MKRREVLVGQVLREGVIIERVIDDRRNLS